MRVLRWTRGRGGVAVENDGFFGVGEDSMNGVAELNC